VSCAIRVAFRKLSVKPHLFPSLSENRKKNSKKGPAETYAKPDAIKAMAQSDAISSLHSTKPPGISTLDASSDGRLILTGGLDKNVQVYDRSSSKLLATLKGHTKKVTAAAFVSAEGEELPYLLVSASEDKTVRLWSTETSARAKAAYAAKATISSHTGEVYAVAVHPSSSLIASAGTDGWALHDISDPAKPATVSQLGLPEDQAATAIAFHPDGAIVGVGAANGSIHVFDVRTGTVAATFADDASSSAITSLSFSENGYILASSSAAAGSAVLIWDLRKQKVTATLAASEGEAKVNRVTWDSSAQFIAAAGSSLRVWQNKAWDAPLVTYDENAAELMGVCWAKEGKELLVAGLDRSVRVLEPKA